MANEEKEPKKEQIINTEAAKAKVEEVAGNVKEGANNFVEKVKGDKALLAVVCAVAAVVVIVLFVILANTVFNGSKRAVKTYANAYVKMNAKKYCKSMHKNIIEAVYDDVDECVDALDERFENLKDDDVKFKSYEIINSKKLDKDDVEDYAEKLEKYYDISEKSLKKVVRYSVNIDAKGSDNDEKVYIYVGKIKGKGYVIDQSNR